MMYFVLRMTPKQVYKNSPKKPVVTEKFPPHQPHSLHISTLTATNTIDCPAVETIPLSSNLLTLHFFSSPSLFVVTAYQTPFHFPLLLPVVVAASVLAGDVLPGRLLRRRHHSSSLGHPSDHHRGLLALVVLLLHHH